MSRASMAMSARRARAEALVALMRSLRSLLERLSEPRARSAASRSEMALSTDSAVPLRSSFSAASIASSCLERAAALSLARRFTSSWATEALPASRRTAISCLARAMVSRSFWAAAVGMAAMAALAPSRISWARLRSPAATLALAASMARVTSSKRFWWAVATSSRAPLAAGATTAAGAAGAPSVGAAALASADCLEVVASARAALTEVRPSLAPMSFGSIARIASNFSLATWRLPSSRAFKASARSSGLREAASPSCATRVPAARARAKAAQASCERWIFFMSGGL